MEATNYETRRKMAKRKKQFYNLSVLWDLAYWVKVLVNLTWFPQSCEFNPRVVISISSKADQYQTEKWMTMNSEISNVQI